MSHGPPQPLSGDFFAFNSQPGSNGGPSVMSNDQAAAAVATMAAQMQQQQQQQQAAQQQQANEDAMMMFFNEQPSAFFDNFEDIPTGLTPQQQQAGVMFPPPQPQQQQQQQQPSLAQQQSATSLPLGFGSTGVVSNGGNININNIQITGNNANDDSPSQDTDGVDGTAATLGGANEPGGGPMPVDNFTSGGPNSAAGGAAGGGAGAAGGALTEFTRRKNWPAKVVEELTDLLQIIEPNGRIRYASPNVITVLGFTPDEMAGQSLTELAHPDDRSVLISDLNACIANASMLRMFVRLRKKDGHYAIVEMVGHAHIGASRFAPNPSNKSPFCQAVFLMSCPYPMKNANLLDSFLEHKMENERLRRRIADLRREEESEDRDDESHAQSQSWVWRQSMDTRSDMASAVASAIAPDAAAMAAAAAAAMGSAMASTMGNNNNNNSATASNNSMSMPPPMTPLRLNLSGLGGMPGGGPNNAALTRENLEGIAARRADSLGDKMARYEGAPGSGNTNASTATNSGTGGTLSTAVAPGSMVTGAPTSAGGGPASAGGGVGGGSKRVPGGNSNGNGGGSNAASSLPMGTTADTIEMLTGLRYTEGERSRRLSTGNRSPRLIKGDAGIAFSVNRDQRTGDKKKKSRLADEYVCTDCGTLESPEWRKGPSGPKTLCNACGLRWAKKEKREKKKAAANAGVLDGVGMAGSADPVSASGGSPLHHEE